MVDMEVKHCNLQTSYIKKDNNKINIENIILMDNDTLKNYKCQLCNKFIIDLFNFELFQCRNGDICCNDCWKSSIENKECKICKSPLESFGELSRNKFMENEFKNKNFKCPYSIEESFIEKDSCFNNNSGNNKSDSNICSSSKEEIIVNPVEIVPASSASTGSSATINEPESVTPGGENGYIVKFCNQILKFESLQQHFNECIYQIIECEKCKNKIQKIDQEKHRDQDCESVIVECQFCNKTIQNIQLSNHYSNECIKYFKECSNKCGQFIKISNLERHLNHECLESMVQCQIVGCNAALIKRSNILNHTMMHLNTQILHTNDLFSKYLNIENKLDALPSSKRIPAPFDYIKNFYIDSGSVSFTGFSGDFKIYGTKFIISVCFSNYAIKYSLSTNKLPKDILKMELNFTFKVLSDRDPNSSLSKSIHIDNFTKGEYLNSLSFSSSKDLAQIWTSTDKRINIQLHMKFLNVIYKNKYETTPSNFPLQLK